MQYVKILAFLYILCYNDCYKINFMYLLETNVPNVLVPTLFSLGAALSFIGFVVYKSEKNRKKRLADQNK